MTETTSRSDVVEPDTAAVGSQSEAIDANGGAAEPPPAAHEPRSERSGSRSAAPAPRQPAYWIAWLILAILVVGGLTWLAQNRIARLERDVVRRVQSVEARGVQRDEQLRLAQDLLRDTQAKALLLEAQLAESVGQQAQLRQLYDEMARSRGDLMLSDVESSILLASQQLQLTGSIQGALLALQDADQALARSNQPALIGLRRLLARDMERLKEVPVADFPTLVARLDAVLAAVDQMPMLAEVLAVQPAVRPAVPRAAGPASARPGGPPAAAGQPPVGTILPPAAQAPAGTILPPAVQPALQAEVQPDPPPAAPQVVAPGTVHPASTDNRRLPGLTTLTELSNRMARTGLQGWEAFVAEFRQLVRVQRIDQPEALLLAPEQRYFARENLRLLLLNARLNLLARNEALVRSDLARATQAIERYFDRDNRTVAGALVTLRQLQSARLAVELPSLSDSIGAVRAARAASESTRR